jgi:VanZ family protein
MIADMITALLNVIQRYWIIFTLVLLATITLLSLTPLQKLPAVPGGDKTHHMIAYAALIFPIALRKPRYWQWIAFSFFAYSGVIELLQPYVNRYGEWLDMAANTTGIIIGILTASLLRRYYHYT